MLCQSTNNAESIGCFYNQQKLKADTETYYHIFIFITFNNVLWISWMYYINYVNLSVRMFESKCLLCTIFIFVKS